MPDAGPLIYLGGAGHLELLRILFERVVVPEVVYNEVVVAGAGLVGAAEVEGASWIVVRACVPDPSLRATLDPGEAAAVPLAEQLNAVLLCCIASAES